MAERAKILIVEDEAIVAMEIESRLRGLGYDVVGVAASGEAAIAKAEETRPDLVLMDIVIQGEMDGIETAEIIGQRFNIAVVYLTAHADEKTLERAKLTGPYAYLLKPFEGRDLQPTIEMALYKHEMELRLKESEDKYRNLVEEMRDGLYVINPEGTWTFANNALAEVFGFKSPENMIGKSFLDFIPPESREEMLESFREDFAKGSSPGRQEVEIIRRDGVRRTVDVSRTMIIEDGKLVGFRGVIRDITERKVAEEALTKRTHDLGERVKELNCLYGISELVEKPDISLEELIQETVNLIPPAWQYPEITCARIILEGEEFTTEDFRETTWKQSSDIVVHGERIGTVEVYYLEERPESDEGPFLKEERDLLNVIAQRLGETIERMRAQKAMKEYSERLGEMVEERTRELREAQVQLLARQRLQQEIELAAQVQTSLLPRGVPSLDGFDFAATALPARYVSGDLYDFTRCGPETCHIVLADIAGKGVPAALLTSTARALMRAETEHEDSPATILASVNTSLYEDLAHAEVFITFLAARLDARLGTLTYANAGHTETLWWQHGSRTCRPLPATGLPMGIYADASIREERLALRPGDALVFYSDGITEAANPQDELFGLNRLMATVSDHVRRPASDLAQAIVEAVETFRAGAPLSDDLTLIVLKVLPRTVSFTHPATLDHLHKVTALVQQVAAAYGSDFAYQMELATSEIVTNVIEHAYRTSSGEMRGRIMLLPDRIQLDLYDDGAPFDISQVPEPDPTELSDSGRGLFVVRQLADELVYDPATPEGNHWRLVKLAEGGQTA
ncbi:MAG: PAS domain S-box protein [Anaerolineales bacterium]|nr:MAG: PAS domain S-box protein [Anaerolineales bacterium]